MDKKDIVILIYMTLECNIRCYYCVVNFKKEYISVDTLDNIILFIKNNRDNFWNVSVEFFWWEPLLVFEKIKYFVLNSEKLNIKYKITTNWILLDRDIIDFFDKYFSSVYISFSDLFIKNIKLLSNIYKFISKDCINKYAITFIYHPDKCYKEHFKFLKLIIWIWFKNLNILPIYMYKNYTKQDFDNLKIFLFLIKKISNVKYEYFYFMENKIDMEFSIMPDWICTLDSWETIYDMKNYSNEYIKIWNIRNLDLIQMINKYENFNLSDYMRKFLSTWLVKQSFENFMQLSDILKINSK